MSSRYEDVQPVTTAFRPGVLYGRELRPSPQWGFSFTLHQITDDDRIDTLADRYLQSVDSWWMICDANPEVLDWINLPPGLIIRIPFVLA